MFLPTWHLILSLIITLWNEKRSPSLSQIFCSWQRLILFSRVCGAWRFCCFMVFAWDSVDKNYTDVRVQAHMSIVLKARESKLNLAFSQYRTVEVDDESPWVPRTWQISLYLWLLLVLSRWSVQFKVEFKVKKKLF